jgi:hypothetical protein
VHRELSGMQAPSSPQAINELLTDAHAALAGAAIVRRCVRLRSRLNNFLIPLNGA